MNFIAVQYAPQIASSRYSKTHGVFNQVHDRLHYPSLTKIRGNIGLYLTRNKFNFTKFGLSHNVNQIKHYFKAVATYNVYYVFTSMIGDFDARSGMGFARD